MYQSVAAKSVASKGEANSTQLRYFKPPILIPFLHKNEPAFANTAKAGPERLHAQ